MGRSAVIVAIALLVLSVAWPARADLAPDPGGNSADLHTAAQLGKMFGFTSSLGGWNSGTSAATEANLIKNAGGSAHRFPVSWQTIQPKPGLPVIGGAPSTTSSFLPDRQYVEAINRGTTPIVGVMDAPAWAAPAPSTSSCGVLWLNCVVSGQQLPHQPPAPSHVDDYAAIVAWVGLRYPKAVMETWNEVNEKYWWGGRAPDPNLMALMQCRAYDVVKSVSPTQKVLSPAFGVAINASNADRMSYADYVSAVYKAMGGRICWDALNIHLYFNTVFDGPGTTLALQMQTVRSLKGSYRDSSPIWVTETGMSTTSKYNNTAVDQARMQIQAVHKLLTMSDIATVLIYNLRDGGTHLSYNNPAAPDYGYGVLTQWLSAKPGYCHWVLLNGHTYAGSGAAGSGC